MTDNEMLNDILANAPSKHGGPKGCSATQPSNCSEDPKKDYRLANVVQWTTGDNRRFIPAAKTCGNLPPGFYSILQASGVGIYFESIPLKTEGLLRFPQANSDRVVEEIQKFWEREDRFKKFGLLQKRGIILFGPPGSGKSCTVQLIMRDVMERGGISVIFTHPSLFIEGIRLFRSIQPATPVVVLMEDIDEILRVYPESEVLNILDGAEMLDKTVFLATTNYPEELGPRIINRPSRFDKRFMIKHPNPESRMMYFDHLFKNSPELRDKYDVGQWVEDTEGLSLAHLKELFVVVVILEDEYKEAIETLKSMREKVSSEYDPDAPMGFGKNGRKFNDDIKKMKTYRN